MLKNHFNFKHTKDSSKHEVDCEKCGQRFSTSWYLINHTRDDHGKPDECVFYKSNRCKFGKHAGKFTMAIVIVIHSIVSLAMAL